MKITPEQNRRYAKVFRRKKVSQGYCYLTTLVPRELRQEILDYKNLLTSQYKKKKLEAVINTETQ